MADRHAIISDNVKGAFFVDQTCTDCEVCRHFAPDIFGYGSSHAFVQKQPEHDVELIEAQRAIFACHVGAIGTLDTQDLSQAKQSLPLNLVGPVYVNGFNAESSFAAHSYFVNSQAGNWMIDSPRFTRHLVKRFEEMGGVDYIFLSHRDDVADADKYAAHFGAKRIIHEHESPAQPDAEIVLAGEGDHEIEGAQILFTPGHTRGSLSLVWQDKYIFTGDHFAWEPQDHKFAAFRNVCWYSWDKQIKSVEKLGAFDKIEWVFPGHGMWGQVPSGKFPKVVGAAVKDMVALK